MVLQIPFTGVLQIAIIPVRGPRPLLMATRSAYSSSALGNNIIAIPAVTPSVLDNYISISAGFVGNIVIPILPASEKLIAIPMVHMAAQWSTQ